MNFGKYDQRIEFISYQDVDDGFGGTIPSETSVLSTFAQIRQLRGGDGIEASKLVLPVSYQAIVQIREGFEPNTTMMIKYREDVYKIAGILKRYERMNKEWIITMIEA